MAEKQIHRMEIEPAANGGHTLTHHYKAAPSHSSKEGMGMSHVPSETHVFGAEDGHGMLAHIANHLHIKETADKDEEGE
jgi:hypothetical protein